jgi:hypothetical protein
LIRSGAVLRLLPKGNHNLAKLKEEVKVRSPKGEPLAADGVVPLVHALYGFGHHPRRTLPPKPAPVKVSPRFETSREVLTAKKVRAVVV